MAGKMSEFVAGAVSTAVAAFLKESIFVGKGSLETQYVLSALGGILAYFIIVNVVKIAFFAFRIDKPSRLRGSWIERVKKDGDQHLSIFEIDFHPISGKLCVTGDTFSPLNFEHFASWKSTAVDIIDQRELYYLHHSVISESKLDVTGFTKMSFMGDIRYPCEGLGYIVDNTTPPKRIDFEFERLDRSLIKKFIGRRRFRSRKDRETFLSKYCEES